MIDAKIVVDSSANMAGCHWVSSVPLKIITDEKEYMDNAELNTAAMVWDLKNYTGRSSTACPSPQDWMDAFGDSPYVFCIAITSNLSGSCNAANIAKADYEQEFPDRKVCVIDSLSTGGEMELIAEKILEWMEADFSFEEISEKIKDYQQHTGLMFMLESMQNLANNGRVNKIVAKAKQYLGVPYKWGGTTPSGFDCSGFVYYVLRSQGIEVSRTQTAMYAQGTPVSKSNLQPGDVVFFQNTYKAGLSHVGIYVGDGQFIHAPSSGKVVSYANLYTDYYIAHYYGAVRYTK
jgi:hypothetical protein